MSARSGADWKSFQVDEVPGEGRFLMERDRARLMALEARPERGPSLFLYRWAEPTISLGYAQREERVLDAEAVRRAAVPVARRPTGGRAILHVDEWTYSAVAPLDHPRLGGTLRDSLRSLSAIVVAALAEVGVDAVAMPERQPVSGDVEEAKEACFHRAVGFELTVGGRKLAGAAQRRLARSLLTQGTILAGPGHERLADFLVGDAAVKRRGRERLRRGTITVAEVSGGVAAFGAFSEALRRAWALAVDP